MSTTHPWPGEEWWRECCFIRQGPRTFFAEGPQIKLTDKRCFLNALRTFLHRAFVLPVELFLLCAVFQGWTEGWQAEKYWCWEPEQECGFTPQSPHKRPEGKIPVIRWDDVCTAVDALLLCQYPSALLAFLIFTYGWSCFVTMAICHYNVLQTFGPKVHNWEKLYLSLENSY